jgi:hypothetical protein
MRGVGWMPGMGCSWESGRWRNGSLRPCDPPARQQHSFIMCRNQFPWHAVLALHMGIRQNVCMLHACKDKNVLQALQTCALMFLTTCKEEHDRGT